MQTFARVINRTAWEVVQTPDGVSIEEMYTPEFISECVDVSNIDPKPAQGWVFKDGVFSEPEQQELDTEMIVARNVSTRDFLLGQAGLAIAPLQYAVDLDIATDAEKRKLQKLKEYGVLVNRVDLTRAGPEWPEVS